MIMYTSTIYQIQLKYRYMGQINCECKQEVVQQQVEQYIAKPTARKIQNRLKTIIESKQIYPKNQQTFKITNYNIQESSAGQYCSVRLTGRFLNIDFDVKRKNMTVGTTLSEVQIPSHSEEDKYKIYMKYQNEKIMLKDSGLGLGVFILKSHLISKEEVLINKGKQFLHAQIKNKKIQIRYWSESTQSAGTFEDAVEVKGYQLIYHPKTNAIQIKHSKAHPFWVYAIGWIDIKQQDLLRCGQSFYKVSRIQPYINSSRLVCKY